MPDEIPKCSILLDLLQPAPSWSFSCGHIKGVRCSWHFLTKHGDHLINQLFIFPPQRTKLCLPAWNEWISSLKVEVGATLTDFIQHCTLCSSSIRGRVCWTSDQNECPQIRCSGNQQDKLSLKSWVGWLCRMSHNLGGIKDERAHHKFCFIVRHFAVYKVWVSTGKRCRTEALDDSLFCLLLKTHGIEEVFKFGSFVYSGD